MDFDAGSGPVPLKDALSAAVSSTLGLRPTMSPQSPGPTMGRVSKAKEWWPSDEGVDYKTGPRPTPETIGGNALQALNSRSCRPANVP